MKVTIHHASAAISDRVRAWFSNPTSLALRDGSRSIILPHPESSLHVLKIKGAGLNGGPVRFGAKHHLGPASSIFDFDGRRVEDIASGHNNSDLGAASFQQAAVEYAMSKRLHDLGYPVVPCIGYGRIEHGAHVTWFSLFALEKGWSLTEEYEEANIRNAKLLLELAVKHSLVGYFWFLQGPDGVLRLKDLHPFHHLSPINASQLSWTLQLVDALYTRCQASRHFAPHRMSAREPSELGAIPLKGILEDACGADYLALKEKVVKPFVKSQPVDFASAKLFDSLNETRVGRALLERCPEPYARWS